MVVLFIASSMSYYIINFQLKYLPGGIYANQVSSGVAEVVGIVLSGIFYNKIGMHQTFIYSFALSVLGASAHIVLEQYSWAGPIMLFLILIGVNSTFTVVYLANVDVFPTLFTSSSLGLINFFGRLFTILAPQIAER